MRIKIIVFLAFCLMILTSGMVTRIALLLLILRIGCHAQTYHDISVMAVPEECYKGSALLSVSGTHAGDTIYTEWSNGQRNTYQANYLDGGNYSVRTMIRHWSDSVLTITDTTIYFEVKREICPVGVPRYFSPNDDGYNDLLYVTNADKHPNFEFCIYDKWGQKVHGQKKNFTPWDGKWNGLNLPDGVYYYVFFFDADNKKQMVQGDLTILR